MMILCDHYLSSKALALSPDRLLHNHPVRAEHPSLRMADENTLSLNPHGQKLLSHEAALRESDFKVISAAAPLDARFEIEMGRCGVFLTSYLTPFAIYRDLANLFRRSCPNGIIIFFVEGPEDNIAHADILLSWGRTSIHH
jgi:hypothetical protein